MEISDQYVECLRDKCDKEVRVKTIYGLTEIIPDSMGIQLICEKCDCGFTTVLEYMMDRRYSYELSCDRSNEGEEGERFWWQNESRYAVYDNSKWNEETQQYDE